MAFLSICTLFPVRICTLFLYLHRRSGMGVNGSRRSNVPIIFRRSDDALNERLYPYEATLFRVRDVQKKRHCPGGAISFGRRHFFERGLLNWRDSSRTALAAALTLILGADRTLPTTSKATIIYKRGRDSRKILASG